MGGIVISCDSWSPKMLGRTQKNAEHWREREVVDGRRRIKRGEKEKVPTLMACDRVSY